MFLIITLFVFIISIIIIEINSNYIIKIDKYEPIITINYDLKNENKNELNELDNLKKNITKNEISIEDYIGTFYFKNENENENENKNKNKNENYGFYICNEIENKYNLLETEKLYKFNIPVFIKIFNIKNENLIYYLS